MTGALRTAQNSTALTLEQGVSTALSKNPQVNAAREAVVAAEQRVIQAGAGTLPTVSAVGSTSYGTTTQFGPPTSDPRSSSSVAITGTLPVYDNGRTKITVDQAQANLAAARATLQQTSQDIALSAASAFFNVLKAQQVATVRAAQLEKAEGQLRQSEAQVRAGTAAEADVLQARAQAAQAQVDLLAARSQIDITKATLRSVLAMEVFSPLEVQDPTALAQTAISISADAAVKEAEADRPEIAKAIADVQSTTAALALAYAGSGLQVNVGLNGTYTILSTTPGSSNSVCWAVTATLTFPVLDGGRAEAAVKEAQANLRAAEAKAESVRLTIRQDAYQAYLAAVQARANLVATEAAQVAAAAALQAAEGRYRAGVGTIVEVTTARATAAQAEVNAITARYDQQAALATLRHALGRGIVGGTL
jgi:outer membrane protein